MLVRITRQNGLLIRALTGVRDSSLLSSYTRWGFVARQIKKWVCSCILSKELQVFL